MNPSVYAALLIKDFEGIRLKAYKCPAGVWTIGYGHTDGVTECQTITLHEADRLLDDDISIIAQFLNQFNLDLNQFQFDALISLIYNIGPKAFAGSTMLRKLKSDANDPTIADEFRRWVFASGTRLPGLEKRREQEIKLYFS